MKHVTPAAVAVLLLLGPQAVLAFDCLVLNQLPVQIDRPGKYCLDQSHDMVLSGGEAAITILASDVDLDLRGHTLRNPVYEGGLCDAGYRSQPAVGISVFEARNVRLHNGALR